MTGVGLETALVMGGVEWETGVGCGVGLEFRLGSMGMRMGRVMIGVESESLASVPESLTSGLGLESVASRLGLMLSRPELLASGLVWRGLEPVTSGLRVRGLEPVASRLDAGADELGPVPVGVDELVRGAVDVVGSGGA